MSLEIAIAENTAAVRELIGILSKGIAPAAPASELAPVDAAPAPAKTEKKTKPAKEEPKAEEPASPPEPADPVTYEQVAAAITAVAAKHGRQGALDVLGRFGAKSGKELKPEQYAEVVAVAKSAVA